MAKKARFTPIDGQPDHDFYADAIKRIQKQEQRFQFEHSRFDAFSQDAPRCDVTG